MCSKEKNEIEDAENYVFEFIDNKNNNKSKYSENLTSNNNLESFMAIREDKITEILENVADAWVEGVNNNKSLKKIYAWGILIFLAVQIIGLLYISYQIVLTTTEIKNIVGYSLYTSGVFGQMLYLPKTVAEHLFPKEEQNHLIELLKLIKEEKNKNLRN